MVERMIEFLSSSAKLPCELLRWAIWHCLHICDNVVATEMQVRINFLISMKADLRQTLVSSCSPSFCIVLVGVGILEKQISELNSQLLMNLLFLPLLNYFLFNCAPGHLTSPSSLHWRLPRLYCLYCHCECQPYKPQFKIYLSSHVLFYLATCLLWSCVSDRCN